MALPPGLAGYVTGQQLNNQNDAAQLQQASGLIGILGQLRAQQQEQAVRGVLASTSNPQEAIPKLLQLGAPGQKIAGVLSTLATQNATRQSQGVTDALHMGQLQKLRLDAQAAQNQQAAQGQLAAEFNPAVQTARNPQLTHPYDTVSPNEASALEQLKAAEASQTPFSTVVPNPSRIQSLAIQADPRSAITAMTKAMTPSTSANVPVGAGRAVTGGYLERQADGSDKFVPTRAEIGAANEDTLTPGGEKVKNDMIRAGLSVPKTRRGQIDNAALNSLGLENEKGAPPVSSTRADYKANSAALTANGKDLAAIRPYNNMLETNGNIAMDLADKVVKTDMRFANKSLNWLRQNAGDNPDAAEFLAQTQIMSTEAARVLNNPRLVGQLTDSARHEMQGIINGDMPINSFKRVVQRMQSDGRNRVNAMVNEHNSLQQQLGGQPSADVIPTSAVTAPTAVGGKVEFNGYHFPSQQALDAYKKAAGL